MNVVGLGLLQSHNSELAAQSLAVYRNVAKASGPL